MFKRLRLAAVGFGLLRGDCNACLFTGHSAHRHDSRRHSADHRPARPGLRRLPLRRLHDLRRAGELGPLEGRRLADIKPGLATEWAAVEGDGKRWIFKLRQGVKFHDGTDFDADVVIWNLEKILNDKSPQFDPKQAAQARAARPDAGRLEGDRQVHGRAHHPHRELAVPLRHVLHLLFQPRRTGRSRARTGSKVALQPAGTGPFKVDRVVPRERLELSRFDGYWDKARVPKLDKVLLFPMPEAATRTAALLAGQVDWIEVPAPDAIPRLKQGGMTHRHQQVSAQLGLPAQHGRGLAVGRHPRAQGGQPRGRPRRPQQAAGRADDRVQGRGLSRPSLVRLAQLRHQVRSGGGQEAAGRGGLQRDQEAQGQDRDLDLGLGPDAAAADERVRAGEPERRRLRRLSSRSWSGTRWSPSPSSR